MGGGDSGDDSIVHFVFVHGASHGAWCWYKLTTLLDAAGFKATSVDLTGAGINLTDSNTVFDFDHYNRPLFSLLSDLPPHHKIILVGHSVGGGSVTEALCKFTNKISMVVYLAADMVQPGSTSSSHDSIIDSNDFCTSMRLPERIYESGVEPPDDPKVIIQHSRMDYVEKVAAVLGKKEFSQIEKSHIGTVVKLARRTSVGFSESLFHFLMQRRVLTKGEALWFTFADQPIRFSTREFYLATGLACVEDETEVKVSDRVVKKPYLWMLGKRDKYTVESLYQMFRMNASGMTKLERFSLGVAIITEGVIIAEKTGTLIPRERLLKYMNYRISKGDWGRVAYDVLSQSIKSLDSGSWSGDGYQVSGFVIAINLWAMSSVSVLGQSLGKPCKTSSSRDPLVLHWDSTTSKTITEVSAIEKMDNVVVDTIFGSPQEYKHLVNTTHEDDSDFDSVVKMILQGYKMKKRDWEQGFVDLFVATEAIGERLKTKNKDVENGQDVDHEEAQENQKDEENQNDKEDHKDEEYGKDKDQRKDEETEQDVDHEEAGENQKDEEDQNDKEDQKDEEYGKEREQRKDEDHSKSNSDKLDELIQMVQGLGKRVETIQKFLGINFPDGSTDKKDCKNEAASGDGDDENEEAPIDEETNSGDRSNATDDENEEVPVDVETNSEDRRIATDEENKEEICDEKANSDTEILAEEESILGENENTEKITQDEVTEKLEEGSCMKQKPQVTSSTQTFNTPNFETRVPSSTPTFTTPKFDLLSQESRNSVKHANEVLMKDVCEIPVFQPLKKIKKRLVQQDTRANDDVEPPLKKKSKANPHDVELRRSERGQIPSIHTQPPFTGARKKHPIIYPFEPVDKTRKEKMRHWKMTSKNKKIKVNQALVTAKWFSDLETPGRKLSKTHIEASLELLKLRKRNNPDLFLNKTALVVGVKFLEEIDEHYDEFLDDKKGFDFARVFDKYKIEKNMSFLYSAIEVEETLWLGIVINLEKRSITAFNCATQRYTDASLVDYVNAYAVVLPFMIRNIFKDVNMSTRKFAINVVSEGLPQALKTEDSGIYAFKLIECHAMRIIDLTKLSEEKIAFIREKLAVDIFSELQ